MVSIADPIISNIPIFVGKSMGAAGVPSRWPGFIQLCSSIPKESSIQIAISKSLESMSLSIETKLEYSPFIPQKVDWTTTLADVSKSVLSEYNKTLDGSDFLSPGYHYMIKFKAQYEIKGNLLIFLSDPEIYYGATEKSAIIYPGPYNKRYFHQLLIEKISFNVKEISCNER